MKNNLFVLVLALSLLLVSCGKSENGDGGGKGSDTTSKNGADGSSVLKFEKNGLKVYAMEGSPEFNDAALSLVSPESGIDLPDGKNKFQFKVENFNLGEQTSDAVSKGIANSSDPHHGGQHIHFILNNEPYHAHYGDAVEADLKAGQYVMLAFLSRSYHESVKNKNAYQIRQFIAGTPKDLLNQEADLNAPHIFFSRPKGEYYGTDTQKLLLDFYLVNCDLSPDGFKVRATINGIDFMLTKWLPYLIEGLPLGDVSVKLELLDAEGNLVKSSFNGAERTVKLLEKKPA